MSLHIVECVVFAYNYDAYVTSYRSVASVVDGPVSGGLLVGQWSVRVGPFLEWFCIIIFLRNAILNAILNAMLIMIL